MILRDGCHASGSVDRSLDTILRDFLLQFFTEECSGFSCRAASTQGPEQNLVIDPDLTFGSNHLPNHHPELLRTDRFTGCCLQFFLSNHIDKVLRIQLDPVVCERRRGIQ